MYFCAAAAAAVLVAGGVLRGYYAACHCAHTHARVRRHNLVTFEHGSNVRVVSRDDLWIWCLTRPVAGAACCRYPMKTLGLIAEQLGDVDGAASWYRKVYLNTRDGGLQLHLATMLPLVYESQQDLQRRLNNVALHVSQLQGLAIAKPLDSMVIVPHVAMTFPGVNLLDR